MTANEAIKQLLPLIKYRVDENGVGTFPMVSTPLQAEALNLAIKALEFQDNVKEAYYSSTGCFELKNYIRELLKGEEE